jgi:antirestriction protein
LVLKCLQIMGNGWVEWSWIWYAHIPAQIQNEAVKRTTNDENKDNDVTDFSSVLLMLSWCDVFVLCVKKHVYWKKPTTLVFGLVNDEHVERWARNDEHGTMSTWNDEHGTMSTRNDEHENDEHRKVKRKWKR